MLKSEHVVKGARERLKGAHEDDCDLGQTGAIMHYRKTEQIRHPSRFERLLSLLARGMRDATTPAVAVRPNPADRLDHEANLDALDETARRHAAGLMRVNHVGEVCAQALYEGHALTVRDDCLSTFFLRAADEERDHLAWTAHRLGQLRARRSLLLPVWYAGSLSLGALAGLGGKGRALGFMAETERQVEAHLQGHLERLPRNDERSRAIVSQMKADEAAHADKAWAQGAVPVPAPVVAAMRFMSKVMTTVAYRV